VESRLETGSQLATFEDPLAAAAAIDIAGLVDVLQPWVVYATRYGCVQVRDGSVDPGMTLDAEAENPQAKDARSSRRRRSSTLKSLRVAVAEARITPEATVTHWPNIIRDVKVTGMALPCRTRPRMKMSLPGWATCSTSIGGASGSIGRAEAPPPPTIRGAMKAQTSSIRSAAKSSEHDGPPFDEERGMAAAAQFLEQRTARKVASGSVPARPRSRRPEGGDRGGVSSRAHGHQHGRLAGRLYELRCERQPGG